MSAHRVSQSFVSRKPIVSRLLAAVDLVGGTASETRQNSSGEFEKPTPGSALIWYKVLGFITPVPEESWNQSSPSFQRISKVCLQLSSIKYLQCLDDLL